MSILFVVAPCNLFNSHLDVASQITGALSLPGSNPRTPLVCLWSRNVGRGLFFSFLSFFFDTEEMLFQHSDCVRRGSPSARGADRSKVRAPCVAEDRMKWFLTCAVGGVR